MIEPQLFIPHATLSLELGLDYQTEVALIQDARPMLTSIRAVNVEKLHFPIFPEWREAADGTSGTLHMMDTHTGAELPGAVMEGNKESTPHNTDGILFRTGENALVSCGVLLKRSVGVWWGVTTFDVSQNASVPDNAWTWLNYIDSDDYRAYDKKRYPHREI